MELLIAGLIGALVGGIAGWGACMEAQRSECPRMALGYNCKGNECDHSFKAQMQIRKDFDRG